MKRLIIIGLIGLSVPAVMAQKKETVKIEIKNNQEKKPLLYIEIQNCFAIFS